MGTSNSKMTEWPKKEETNRQGKKDPILPLFASSNRYTALSDYNIVSIRDNGMSLPIDYGTLYTAYNSESIFKNLESIM